MSVLPRSFIHTEGIGAASERRLWAQGADCWGTFLADPTRFKIPRTRLPRLLETVSRSPEALSRGDYRFFGSRLPRREHWRALHAFSGRVAYLDIETDGGTEYENITVIGLYDGREFRQFIKGENLLEFEEAVEEIALLVTYNGSGFDVPVLQKAFLKPKFDQLHLDLCPTLRRLGLKGGLKGVEYEVGIQRSPATTGLNGWDAVRLWRQWRWGSREALDLLLAYNREDVMNMVPLARLAYDQLSARIEGALEGVLQ